MIIYSFVKINNCLGIYKIPPHQKFVLSLSVTTVFSHLNEKSESKKIYWDNQVSV